MSFKEFVQRRRLEAESEPQRLGTIKVYVGPARSSKTGQLWLEAFRLEDGRRSCEAASPYQAFHFGEAGFSRQHQISSLMLRLDFKKRTQLAPRDIELLRHLHQSRVQTITNEPLNDSEGILSPLEILALVEPRTKVVFVDDAHLFGAGLVCPVSEWC